MRETLTEPYFDLDANTKAHEICAGEDTLCIDTLFSIVLNSFPLGLSVFKHSYGFDSLSFPLGQILPPSLTRNSACGNVRQGTARATLRRVVTAETGYVKTITSLVFST